MPRHWTTSYDSTRTHSGHRRMATHSAPARRPQRRAKSCETEVSQNESGETHIGGYLFLQKLLPVFLPFWCKKRTDTVDSRQGVISFSRPRTCLCGYKVVVVHADDIVVEVREMCKLCGPWQLEGLRHGRFSLMDHITLNR